MTDELTLPETKELTVLPEFEPTPHMEKWLDTTLQLMTDNITEIERVSKITAQSWYGWLKKPGFIDWYNNEWERKLKATGPQLDCIGLKFAKRGDYKFWEGMQQRIGHLQSDNKPAVAIQNNINLDKYIK